MFSVGGFGFRGFGFGSVGRFSACRVPTDVDGLLSVSVVVADTRQPGNEILTLMRVEKPEKGGGFEFIFSTAVFVAKGWGV